MLTSSRQKLRYEHAQRRAYLTGLETQPLNRITKDGLDNMLDTVMSLADWELSKVLQPQLLAHGYKLDSFHLYSISLFYHEGEEDMLNYAGFTALYHSYDGGHPIVQQYEDNSYVCWTGKDADKANAARVKLGLRRYRLFLRCAAISTNKHITYSWRYSHAGQLLLQ